VFLPSRRGSVSGFKVMFPSLHAKLYAGYCVLQPSPRAKDTGHILVRPVKTHCFKLQVSSHDRDRITLEH
jgi:hypothetical protein